MNPDGFTLAQLDRMAEARRKDEWERASAIVAMVYNMHRGPKSRYIKPSEFNPYTQPKPLVISREEAHTVFRQMADAARGR